MELTFPLFAGLLAAALHVITGPDHLAAVTPFAIENKKKAWKIGLFWGVGHILGMLSIGFLFLFFKELIPLEKISNHSEKIVGIILIGLGIWIFLKLFFEEKKHKHLHVHSNGNVLIHKHQHSHNSEKHHNHEHPNLKQGITAATAVGFIHGLAGVAHFVLFIPVIGFSSKFDSLKYIIGFGIGTLIAMTTFAFVIGGVSSFDKQEHNKTFFKGLRLAGGLFAFLIGIYWTISN